MNEDIFSYLNKMASKEVLNDYELARLKEYSKSDDYEIRMNVAEILAIFQTEKSKSLLMNLAKDKNYLVRVNACDSLSVYYDKEVLSFLINVIKHDKSRIVKTYAILSARDIALNLDDESKRLVNFFLKDLIKKETCDMVLVASYSALYLLQDSNYINKIFDELKNKRYKIRCFAVNMLFDIADANNKDVILKKLLYLHDNEKTTAVKSTLNYIIKRLNEE